ncbi:MAG TPA: LLM class F420-dependent oxidoreductase [Steroidobacteraceae bacterium]|nr:LLM class F420-dependent oxidoreductase [Steroidobacteraceae bacterium]
MRLGVVFPQTEIGSDPSGVHDYAQAAEELGYKHLLVFDHVVGANPERPGGWGGPYTYKHSFHEPFVLFGYLAGITRSLELVTGILILPQRQTALVAKQAAAVDVLSRGRLRLGVGVGWNAVEFEALGQDFSTRGRRMEEQIKLLRALWTQPLVAFDGRFDSIPDAGINPLPVQQPIPIWMGGTAESVIKRTARLADGWFPQFRPGPDARETIARLHQYAREAGRDPASIGIEGRISAGTRAPDEWRAAAEEWRSLGATHLSFNTMGSGYTSPSQHIDAIRRFIQAMEVRG